MRTWKLLLITQLAFITICNAQLDNSFTYVNLIAQNNLSINEDLNQRLINWGEIPFNLDKVSKMTESYYTWIFSEEDEPDTLIMVEGKLDTVKHIFDQVYEYEPLPDDSFRITIDSSFIMTYNEERIVSQEEYNSKMEFSYYDSGLLRGLNVAGKPFLLSEEIGDTIKYRLSFGGVLGEQAFDESVMPSITINCIKASDGCFRYENVFYYKDMMPEPVVNKSFLICSDGKLYEDVVLDRGQNYKSKYHDFKFNYEGGLLMSKICDEDVRYHDFRTTNYEYDEQGRLIRISDQTITSHFTYDDRGNIIERRDYFSGSKRIQKYWVRDIEYID